MIKHNLHTVIILLLLVSNGVLLNAQEKVSVLIIDGFSNHNWQLNTSYLTKILEASGKFKVDVSTCPIKKNNETEWNNWKPDFQHYPVVIQTCNNLGKEDISNWPDTIKKSFEDYVSNGGGVYIYHGATNAFKNWEVYNKMIGLAWRNKDFGKSIIIDENENAVWIPKGEGERTNHGPRSNVLVTRMNNHPIHKGMPKSWLTADNEVYRYARTITDSIQVISYARGSKNEFNFPKEWVLKYGKGKIYASTYGHLWKEQIWPPSMRCVAFQETMTRAVLWLSGNKIDAIVSADFPTSNNIALRKILK